MEPQNSTIFKRDIDEPRPENDPDDILFHPPIPSKLGHIIHEVEINATKQRIMFFIDSMSAKAQYEGVAIAIIKGSRRGKHLEYDIAIYPSSDIHILDMTPFAGSDDGYWSEDDKPILSNHPLKILETIYGIERIEGQPFYKSKIIMHEHRDRKAIQDLLRSIYNFSYRVTSYTVRRINMWKVIQANSILPLFEPPDAVSD